MKLMQNSGVPIYQQIADSFKTDILAGRYEQGEFLPSIRGLAKDLKISVITTMKAYEQLADEGLITAAQGKGFYVNAQDSEMIKEQHLRKVEESLTGALRWPESQTTSLRECLRRCLRWINKDMKRVRRNENDNKECN